MKARSRSAVSRWCASEAEDRPPLRVPGEAARARKAPHRSGARHSRAGLAPALHAGTRHRRQSTVSPCGRVRLAAPDQPAEERAGTSLRAGACRIARRPAATCSKPAQALPMSRAAARDLRTAEAAIPTSKTFPIASRRRNQIYQVLTKRCGCSMRTASGSTPRPDAKKSQFYQHSDRIG